MEETPDRLLNKLYEAPTVFTKFALKTAEYKETGLYCFVEGLDMRYYSSPIRNNSDLMCAPIICKGKENVKKIYYYLKDLDTYRKYVKRFFVDADYDDNTNLPKEIYVTPGYSIENFYVDEDCMKRILETEYEIDPVVDSKLFDKTIKLFNHRLSQFHKAVVRFNAWYACLYSDPEWNHKGVSLGVTFPTDLMKYNIDSDITATYTLAEIQNMYPDAPIIDEKEVEKKMEELLNNPQKMRGKYELEFLIKFIKFLNQDAGSKNRQFTKKNRCYTFGDNVALASLAIYSNIPKDLKNYIRTGTRTANYL